MLYRNDCFRPRVNWLYVREYRKVMFYDFFVCAFVRTPLPVQAKGFFICAWLCIVRMILRPFSVLPGIASVVYI